MKTTFLTLSTGYILMFFSEHVFWARYRPGQDTLADLLFTWLAYSLLAYVFLCVIRLFRVRQIWALFLCGALFGWLAEGVIVQTMYADFPINLAWTGLAWHALISVCFGWYALRRILLENKPSKTILVAGLAGVIWGIWAIFWWLEDPATRNSPVEFAAFAFAITGLLIASEWVFNWFIQAGFSPNKWVLTGFCSLLALNFALVAIPAVPAASLVLPPLLALVLYALWRNRQIESETDLLEYLQGPIHSWNYTALFAMPAAAALVYSLADLVRLEIYTNYGIFILTTIVGATLFIISLAKILRTKQRTTLTLTKEENHV